MKSTLKYLAATLVGTLCATVSQAAPYQSVQADKSTISFRYKQMGVGMDGHFRKFNSVLNFDPSKPEQASATIEVDLTTADTGTSDADQEVVGKAWFNTLAFPKAVFALKNIKQTAPNMYEGAGTLSIKGQARELKFAMKHAGQGRQGQLTASFNLARADFAIGEGMWSKFDVIANDVQVTVQLNVLAAK